MSEWKGDFLGFRYGKIHSSDLGIVRVSNGSRFEENLLPTQQNRTVNIPGRDETYFFGSDSTQKQFNIAFAFDNMTQSQLNTLRELFGGKEIRELEFDEREKIIWKAKVSSSSIKYIPFENGIYKGEGSVSFVCYQPFGLETISTKCTFDADEKHTLALEITNTTNFELDWELLVPGFPKQIKLDLQREEYEILNLSDDQTRESIISYAGDVSLEFPYNSTDCGLYFDSKTGLVRGLLANKEKSYKIYNRFISNPLTKLPKNEISHIEITYPDDDSEERVCVLTYTKKHY